ncbi:HU family DNA-binding protein [Kitasatospora sp. DSM 101779]|uniref:HU family DNA-binding protein n=1 Tax=Kitasatospora sp. DSM 101779 TaxID=2853165 RepID=UPI0021DAA4A8|nr:HU family DNA-binding protein [Kitasatospora sp. DSM 101779]MCU7827004.1 HU family DNA-binding protein [Kitasatospora sp. DSM 101779]
MNKGQLVEAVAGQLGSRTAAEDAVDAVLDAMVRAVVAGERVQVTGFGTLEKVERAGRYARNPQTGERVRVKKTNVPRFRPGQGFKDLVSGAKKLPKSGPATAKAPKGSLTAGKSAAAAPARKRATAKRTAAAAATAPAAAKKTTARKTTTAKTATTAKKTTAAVKKTATPAKKTTTRKTTATAKKSTAPAKKTATAQKTAPRTAKKATPAKRTTRRTTA